MDQQAWKERASLLAAKRGMSLYSRGHHVYGVYMDGAQVLVCGSQSLQDLWVKACGALRHDREGRLTRPARYTLTTPLGVFEAGNPWALFWSWLRRKRAPFFVEER